MMVPWLWPPPIPVASGGGTTDDVTNASHVPVSGATLSSVLDLLYTPGNSAFVQTPAAPSAFDLIASRMTSPDLADVSNGWLVNDWVSGNTLTRAGDVNRFGAGPAADTYQSTLSGGLLFLRTPGSQNVVISKRVEPGTSGYTLRAHSWVTKQTPNGSFTSQAVAFVWSAGTSGLEDGPVLLSATQSQTSWMGCGDSKWIVASVVQGNATIVSQDVTIAPDFADMVNYIHVAPAPAPQALAFDSGSAVGFLQPGIPASTSMTQAINRAGLITTSGPNGLLVIDALNFLPYLTFP